MSIVPLANGLVSGVDAAVPTDLVYRLSVERYHRMIAAGVFDDEPPLELLDGWLVPKMMKYPQHTFATEKVRRAIADVLPAAWHLRVQEPITLATSEPEPDIVVAHGDFEDYRARHPGANEVALVIEVADTSYARDASTKKRIYAQAGIPVYWIVNLPELRIEIYDSPTGSAAHPDYHQRRDYGPGDAIPILIEGVRVADLPVQSVLP